MFLLGLPQHANILHPSLSAMWFATPGAVSLSGATNKMENRKTISLLIADTKTPPSSSPPHHTQMRFHSPIWSFGQQVETRYQLVIKRCADTRPDHRVHLVSEIGQPSSWLTLLLLSNYFSYLVRWDKSSSPQTQETPVAQPGQHLLMDSA